MKKNSLVVALITVFSMAIFVNCGGGSKASPEMKGFMSMIQGKDGDLEKALIKYGMNKKKAGDFTLMKAPYTFSNPSIKKAEKKGNMGCYILNMKHGMADSDYEICWKDKKVASIKEL